MKCEKVNKYMVLSTLSLVSFTVMADALGMTLILPAISKSLQVSITSASIIISAYMISYGFFALIHGHLSDKFGRKQLILFILTAFIFFTIICGVANSLSFLIMARILTGIVASAVIPISLTIISDIFPIESRGKAIGIFMGIVSTAPALSILISGYIIYYLNWRYMFFGFSIITLISLVIVSAMPKVLFESTSRSENFLQILWTSQNLKVYSYIFMGGFLITGAYSWLGAFLEYKFHLNEFQIGLHLMIVGIASLLGGPIGSALSDKLGRGKFIPLGLSVAALSIGSFTYLNSLDFVIVALAGIGFGRILNQPTLVTILTENISVCRGTAMAVNSCVLFTGSGIGVATFGILCMLWNFELVFLFYGGILIFIAILAYFLF